MTFKNTFQAFFDTIKMIFCSIWHMQTLFQSLIWKKFIGHCHKNYEQMNTRFIIEMLCSTEILVGMI